MTENLALMIAHRRVHAYAGESEELRRRHSEAMECRDCENFLKSGIDAFKWLRRAEDTMREADYEGLFELTPEFQKALDLLYTAWLAPCEFAEKWISSLNNRGYAPDNLIEFRSACAEAEETVQNRNWQCKVTVTRAQSFEREEW